MMDNYKDLKIIFKNIQHKKMIMLNENCKKQNTDKILLSIKNRVRKDGKNMN